MLKCTFKAVARKKKKIETELFALDLFLKIILMLKKIIIINPDNYLNKTIVSWLTVSCEKYNGVNSTLKRYLSFLYFKVQN